MANLQETPTWEAGIYQLETSDPVMGGENGIDNRAPRQLANRTLWLKNELARQIEAVNSGKLGKTENAVSATKLATARNISTTGDATWSVLFDGSTNASGALTLANSGVTAGSYNAVTVDSKGRVTRGLTQVHGLITATTATGTANQATTNTNTYLNIVASGVGSTSSVGSSTQITGTNGITVSSDTAGKLIVGQVLANSLTDTSTAKALTALQGKVLNDKITATDAKADNKVDKSGDAMTGVLTLNNQSYPRIQLASNRGNQALLLESGGTVGTHCLIIRPHTDGVVGGGAANIARFNLPTVTGTKTLATEDGNIATATKLQTARTISTTGDATWSVSFDGSTDASGALTLANSGVTTGSYNSVTVDAKGRVTRGLTQVHGLITATTATGTANQATTNTNTYLNIVASGVGSTASVGSSTQVTGTNGISISSDTTGQLIISRDSNSPTATKLQTPCRINGVVFDGTANITIADATKAPAVHRHNWSEIDGKPSTFTPSSHTHAWSQITGVPSASTTTQGIVQLNDTLVSTATDQALTANQGKVLNDKITATDAKADNKVDKSGDVMTGVLTLNNQLWPRVQLASSKGQQALLLESGGTDGTHCLIIRPHTDGFVAGSTPNIARFNLPTVTGTKTLATEDGNIASATKLQNARTISLTGAVSGSVSFDGSGNVSIATTLTATNVREYSSTMTGILGAASIILISGQVVTSPDGRITQYIHLQHFRDIWFPMNQNSVGNYPGEGTRSRLLQIPLWTAMPNKILSVSAQAMRSTHSTQSAGFFGEAAEHQVAWAKKQQAYSKTHAFVEMARIRGGTSEEIDMFIIVEGY